MPYEGNGKQESWYCLISDHGPYRILEVQTKSSDLTSG